MMSLKSAKEFQKKYGVDKLNCKVLQSIIESQGYRFIEFNGIADSKEIQTLIELLDVKQNVLSSRCFIYQDEHHRLLFIHEDLNEEERLVVLAHEEGHIWNKHMIQKSSLYDNVLQEFEANEFAHYILKDKTTEKRIRWLIIALVAVISGILIGVFTKEKYDSFTYTKNLYITESGTKYHRKECVYVRDRKDVHRMTLKQFESDLYEPCEVCFPNDQGSDTG